MALPIHELNALLEDLPPRTAAEIREFANRDPQAQNVYLYRELTALRAQLVDLQGRKTISDKLFDYGNAAALVAYLLFQNRNNLPHM